MKIHKAIVLAAGHGTRLRPFTCATPKPLMPVWGVPMLARIVAMLREWGVDDIAFNTHCLHEQVKAWADGYRRSAAAAGDRVHVKVSYEPEILGTGGVLNPLREWIDGEPFYLVNGDIVVENAPDPSTRIRNFDSPSILGCCLVSESGPRTIEVEPESGFVTNWKSQDAGWDGTYTYCGISALKPDVLKFVEPQGFSSIVTAYEKAMMSGKFMKALKCPDMLWTDAGTIPSYIDLNRDGDDNAFAEFPQVKAALAAAGASPNVSFMGARGSERVFFRCDKGIVVLYDDGNRDENGLYAAQARYLKARGISVPDVVVDLPGLKALVMSDAGKERKMALEDYVKVVEALVRFNALGSEFASSPADPDLPTLLDPFDPETWRWEHNLFRKHCLGTRFQMEMPRAVEGELANIVSILEREPKALVHRDFQSTNVIWKGDELTFIDFQGMRLGPAAYDLASLVYDPYVTFTEGERRALVALYAKKSGREDIVKILPYAAVQRLLQCLGAYGRLASVGQPQFARHSLAALVNLLDAADKAGLDAVGALAEDLIAREKKFQGLADDRSDAHACTCGHDHDHADHVCTCGHRH